MWFMLAIFPMNLSESLHKDHHKPSLHKRVVSEGNFYIQEILKIDLSDIQLHPLAPGQDLEHSYEFNRFLEIFNQVHDTQLTVKDILYSKTNFRSFLKVAYYILGSLNGDPYKIAFMEAFDDLEKRYLQNLRSIERYYDEIWQTLYYPKGLMKDNRQVRDDMYMFEQAYSLVKLAFRKKTRDSQERYFEHLKGTMEIVLRELPNPNLDRVIIALLHDVVEDVPEYKETLEPIFGKYIADGVHLLSKKKLDNYLHEWERKIYELWDEATKKKLDTAAKKRRVKDYFGHLEQLNDDYLAVKFADRLHNLRDMESVTPEKIQRKIEETEKYFLPVAASRSPVAYKLMLEALEPLKRMLSS
jgi:hypothetical protein